ncbi:hypothetical protein HZA87_05525 [Candidatus Uhrbacteria bacterium]|nr:hypothetical protein [Candidatus Uhrbacteria bacterium]
MSMRTAKGPYRPEVLRFLGIVLLNAQHLTQVDAGRLAMLPAHWQRKLVIRCWPKHFYKLGQ